MTTTPKAPPQAQDRELARAFTGCLAAAIRQAARLVASDSRFDRGLIDRIECTKDRRMRRYTLTNAGRKTLREALPLWQAAQEDIAHRLGGDVCTMMRSLSGVLVDD